jgi:hypothetical protein
LIFMQRRNVRRPDHIDKYVKPWRDKEKAHGRDFPSALPSMWRRNKEEPLALLRTM